MSNSESEEEFESADEDFDDKRIKESSLRDSEKQSILDRKKEDELNVEGRSKIEEQKPFSKSEISEKHETLKSSKPPIREECWEYENWEEGHKELLKKDTNIKKSRDENEDFSSSDINKIQSKTECVAPPIREECWEYESWEEGHKELLKRNKNIKKSKDENKEPSSSDIKKLQSKTECVAPPIREECWEYDNWEEGHKNFLKKNENLKKSKQELGELNKTQQELGELNQTQFVPDSLEPPIREECWEIDDWGQEEVETVIQKDKNISQVEKHKAEVTHSINKTQPYTETALNRAEGWEFENWEEEKIENPSIVSQIDDSSADGWDFDDWGENFDEQPESKTPLKPNSSTVLNEIKKQSSAIVDNPKNYRPTEDQNCSDVLDKLLEKDSAKNQSWGWKPWGGVVSLFSTASEGVASLTTNVSKGLSNVIENSIGVPGPEQMAKLHKEEVKKKNDSKHLESGTEIKDEKISSLENIVSNVTQISNRVISGGLDTLEGIGKKTMNILQENDPGLMNKRKMLGLDNDRPVLSQVLREAKQKTEQAEQNLKQIQKHHYKKQLHFETLFDDYHGLVHLEALEMLSKQSSLKLQTLLTPLTGKALADLQETLSEVAELCDLPDQDSEDSDGLHSAQDLSDKLSAAVEDLGITVDFKEILRCWDENTNWLIENTNLSSEQEIHDKALHCLAQSTALAVNKMHKLAEMVLILDHHSTANEADCFVQLTTVFCWHLSGIASRFSDKLTENGSSEDVNSFIVSIFYEGSNSTTYIQKTFQLFVPILQIGAA